MGSFAQLLKLQQITKWVCADCRVEEEEGAWGKVIRKGKSRECFVSDIYLKKLPQLDKDWWYYTSGATKMPSKITGPCTLMHFFLAMLEGWKFY